MGFSELALAKAEDTGGRRTASRARDKDTKNAIAVVFTRNFPVKLMTKTRFLSLSIYWRLSLKDMQI
jgi:hypothetical protein